MAINGTPGDDIIYGTTGDDIICGLAGSDTIDGGVGADTMIGGAGNDTYYVDSAVYVGMGMGGGTGGDVVAEDVGGGTDTIISSLSLGLNWYAPNVENLTLTGIATIAVGNSLDNLLIGNDQNNILNGREGADTMIGGIGDDRLVVDNTGDVVVEYANEGVDTLLTYIDYTLGSNVENLVMLGSVGMTGTGNELDNEITGTSANDIAYGMAGNDTINGGVGADTMYGGEGDDRYYVDSASDIVIENAGAGTDTVVSSISLGLELFGYDAPIENLTLTGIATIGVGNNLDNLLIGNDQSNILNGREGADTMIGGLGDDRLVVDNVGDVIIEYADQGTDTVISFINYTLGADLEKLELRGGVVGTGNDLNNTYIIGSTGNSIIESATGGIDTVEASVDYTLDANIENLTLTGSDAISGSGNDLDNYIVGTVNTAANILAGGLGDDTYRVGTNDTVAELAGEGVDTAMANSSFTLTDNVENLVSSNRTANLVGIGNALDNVISVDGAYAGWAGDGNGYGGNDTIDGGIGADTMSGAGGNDTYYVDNAGDFVVEIANEGKADTVITNIDHTLEANVENIVLVGSGITATGNQSDNVYTVNDTGNTIIEAANGGTDRVDTTLASYTLEANIENLNLVGSVATYGTGNELNNSFRSDTASSTATLAGGQGDDFYLVKETDVVIENAGEGIDTVYLRANSSNNITNDVLPSDWYYQLGFLTYTLGDNVENLVMDTYVANGFTRSGVATGNELDNDISIHVGANPTATYSGDDILDGGIGADTMFAGEGNDTYYVDNAGDVVIENAYQGVDTIISSANYTLSANVENMTLVGSGLTATGNSLDNSYFINDAGNSIIEGANGGIDRVNTTVSYTLDANIEMLYLEGANAINGTGNELDNTIFSVGNAAANVASGGLGNDLYYIGAGDTVVENAGEGIDTISIGFTSGITSYTLADNVEDLTIRSRTVSVTGIGNDLDNVIVADGNYAYGGTADVIDGGAGADTMSGHAGSDTYYVDNSGDVIIEVAGEGTADKVISSVTHTLEANVENLTLTGSGNIDATGNGANNILTGNSGNNTLTGGAGADTFVFTSALSANNVDTISDFASGSDHIQLALAIFGGIGATGTLNASAFASGAGVTSATTANQHLLYDTTSGSLYYDADGVGGIDSVAFATLTNSPAISATDFVVA